MTNMMYIIYKTLFTGMGTGVFQLQQWRWNSLPEEWQACPPQVCHSV